ncbi:MAG: DUF2141 domain-containing protein [Sphingomonadaceae bacterium]
MLKQSLFALTIAAAPVAAHAATDAAVQAKSTITSPARADDTEIFGDAAACGPDARGPAVLVTVDGFRDRTGQLRISIYRAQEEEFLASGKYVTRIDTPMTESGPMTVCAPVPENGPHAIVALHDRNQDGKLNVWSDGFGFSNNPRLGHSKPKVDLVETRIAGIVPMRVILNYAQGLSARPWRGK